MLRRITIVIALLAVACFATFVVWSSSSFQDCVERQQSAYSQGGKGPSARGSRAAICIRCAGHVVYEYRDAATAVATVFIALFTFTLWWSTKAMMKATKEAVDLGRQEFVATHRPKIRIKHVWLMSQLHYDEPIVVRVIYVNVGTAKATMVDYGIKLLVHGEGKLLPPDMSMPHTQIDGELLPGISLKLPDFSFDLKEDEEIGFRSGKANLYCVGYLHYMDDANRVRTTAFCRNLKRAAVPFDNTGRFLDTEDPDYEFED